MASDELSFEQALLRLEEIVGELDSGELPLEAALARFEEAMVLKALCATRLAEAEAKVEVYGEEAG
jgi:exodeoxyribonuclease VII small subunit